MEEFIPTSRITLNLSTVIFFVQKIWLNVTELMFWYGMLILQPLVTILLFAIVFSSIMQVDA